MLKRLAIIIIFSFPILNFSQDFSEFWEGHFSYLNIIEIVGRSRIKSMLPLKTQCFRMTQAPVNLKL